MTNANNSPLKYIMHGYRRETNTIKGARTVEFIKHMSNKRWCDEHTAREKKVEMLVQNQILNKLWVWSNSRNKSIFRGYT